MNTIENLIETRDSLTKALEKINTLILEEERKSASISYEGGKLVVHCELYLFPEPTQMFDRTQPFASNAEKKGNLLGITYHEETPIARVVFSSPNDDDDKSWNDHSIPKELVSALGLDKDKRFYAPGFIPASLLEGKNTGDKLVLTPAKNVEIICTLTAGTDSFKSVLWDDMHAMLPLYKDLATSDNIIDEEKGRCSYFVGLIYENGWSCMSDNERANKWFHKAAELGNKRASWRIGAA